MPDNKETQPKMSLKTGCAICDGKKLPYCFCKKSGAGGKEQVIENKDDISQKKFESLTQQKQPYPTEDLEMHADGFSNSDSMRLLLTYQKNVLELKLAPHVDLMKIKEVLKDFILDLANQNNLIKPGEKTNLNTLAEKLGIIILQPDKISLSISIDDQTKFSAFVEKLKTENLVALSQEQMQEVETMTQRSNFLNPFNMRLTY